MNRNSDSYPGFQYTAMLDIRRFEEMMRGRSYANAYMFPVFQIASGRQYRDYTRGIDSRGRAFTDEAACYIVVCCTGRDGCEIFHIRCNLAERVDAERYVQEIVYQIQRPPIVALKSWPEPESWSVDEYRSPFDGEIRKLPKRKQKTIELECGSEAVVRPIRFDE